MGGGKDSMCVHNLFHSHISISSRRESEQYTCIYLSIHQPTYVHIAVHIYLTIYVYWQQKEGGERESEGERKSKGGGKGRREPLPLSAPKMSVQLLRPNTFRKYQDTELTLQHKIVNTTIIHYYQDTELTLQHTCSIVNNASTSESLTLPV